MPKTPRRSIADAFAADAELRRAARERQLLKDAPAARKVKGESAQTEQLNVRLPSELVAQLKVALAWRHGNNLKPYTLGGCVEQALTAWLATAAKTQEPMTPRAIARQLKALAAELESGQP